MEKGACFIIPRLGPCKFAFNYTGNTYTEKVQNHWDCFESHVRTQHGLGLAIMSAWASFVSVNGV